MKKCIFAFITISFISLSFAQNKTAYVIYNAKGKKVSYNKMIRTLAQKSDVLLSVLMKI